MPFLILFLLSWTAFFLFADRSRWHQFLPACMLAMLMSIISDVVVTDYPLWLYHDPTELFPRLAIHLFDDLGIYPVVTYLFLQYFPSQATLRNRLLYFGVWTTGVILLEYLFCRMGWMIHKMWWTLFCSYLADWVIFYILLRFSKTHRFVLLPSGRTVHLPKETQVQMSGSAFLLQLPAASHVPMHFHTMDQLNIVLEGQLVIEHEGQQTLLSAGERVLMPAHCWHGVQNPASAPAVVMTVFSDDAI
ncbi:MAG: cupin domain-containing protein [Tumebacillaceae bacterium]